MKIAIQGHPTRGKEVIQILESLGGKNFSNISANNHNWSYCIKYGYITALTHYELDGYKRYTLEEFEKEFLFKVGDKVLIKGCTLPREIIRLEWCCNQLCYKLSNGLHYEVYDLEPYKEMKEMEERNITLTLEKAKEWYNKGGELREIALQAFKESELNPLPRSWEEFATNQARMGYYISADGKPLMCASSGKFSSPHVCPSKKSAEAHLAMIQLEQLRNCWWNGWKPDWLNCNENKYAIKGWRDKSSIDVTYVTHAFLSFPTYELALEFQECFRDLIEQAGDLI